jgi:hypothetical protein
MGVGKATAKEPGRTAWDKPEWVQAVMLYPRELVLLEHMACGTFERLARRSDEQALGRKAARAGRVAGNVLAALYVFDASPWQIHEPSLAKAIHCAEKLAQEDRNRGAPRGHTKIQACYDAMRPVAHLWAALRLHWEYPTRPHEELIQSPGGISTLLGIAHGIQKWAVKWKPRRASESDPLLGDTPWLVPGDIPVLRPPWPDKQPDWLLTSVSTYKRRSRN